MTSFINNDVASGAIVRASDHNTQGASIAAVLNGGIDNANIATGAAIDGSKLADGSIPTSKLTVANSASRSYITTAQTTTSTTFTELTTTQAVTVTVGSKGIVMLHISSGVGNTAVGNYTLISYAASGANTIAASDDTGAYHRSASTGAGETYLGKTFLLTGLTAGSTTFTLKFRCSAGTSTFERREIWAWAL